MGRRLLLALLVVLLLVGCNSPTPSPSSAATLAPSVSPTGGVSAPPSTAIPPSAAPTGAAPSGGPTGDTPPRLSIEPFVSGLQDPVDITWRPNDPSSLFVVEQAGRIRIVREGKLVERPFLDITDVVRSGGEQGLLGLAFLPGSDKGRFFVYYTDKNARQVVASYDTDPADHDVAAPATAQIWLRMADSFPNHNGGSMVFGPDGDLYIGTGDGGGGGDPLRSGQRVDTLLAKILRIDVSGPPASGNPVYDIPADNPFVRRPPALPEIFDTGLRNPWRIRFDRSTGDLWIGDVGQGDREEIDVSRKGVSGLDFGWNIMEGTACYPPGTTDCADPDLTLPVTDYTHDLGCSVTGGTVYRGARFPTLVGWYLFSDYCSGEFWAIDSSKDRLDTPTIVAETEYAISAINEDAQGELYATDLSSGQLVKIGVEGA
jgi:glucose/arabinose dehydrogenase